MQADLRLCCSNATNSDFLAIRHMGLSSEFTNNKDADQPAHLRRLISAFVIRSLKSIIPKIAASEIPIFSLLSVAGRFGLNLTLSETPKTGFLHRGPYYQIYIY